MSIEEIEQIKNILSNYENSKKRIPYLSDLQQHPIFWNIFSNLSDDEEKEINYSTNKAPHERGAFLL